MGRFSADVRFALRSLRLSPGFAAAAVVTIALGLGTTTAMFSVVNAVMLQPLPYRDPEQLVLVWQEMRARNVTHFPFSPADYGDLIERNTTFADVAAVRTVRQTVIAQDGTPRLVHAAHTTTNFLSLIGARVALGRHFEANDGILDTDAGAATGARAAPQRALLSHDFWRREYGGDPAVVGRMIRTDSDAGGVEIVGVLAPEVELLFPYDAAIERRPEVWLAARTQFAGGERMLAPWRVVARLAPGVGLHTAQFELDSLAADLRKGFPIKAGADLHIVVKPMFEDLTAEVRPALTALMGAVTFLLLIACANVAGLLVARATRRTSQMAVRVALGASPWQVVRHVLAESLVVSGLGAAVGLALAAGALRLLQAIGPDNMPRLDQAGINPVVLVFAALAAFVSAAVFGLGPALAALRVDVIDVLRRAGRSPGLYAHRLRDGIIVAEVALSFVLLLGFGLMLRSYVALQQITPGFDSAGVATFFLPQVRGATPAARQARMEDLRARLSALPGVSHVTAASSLPFDGFMGTVPYGPVEAAADASLQRQADARFVLPGYFAAMQTRIVDGREFTDADNRPDVNVVVIDAQMAAKLFPGQRAVGRQIFAPRVGPGIQTQPFEVIGVSEVQRSAELARIGREALFFADARAGSGVARRWVIRTSGDGASLAAAVRATVAAVDPTAVVADERPLAEYVDTAMGPTRFLLVLIGVFGAIAVVLVVVGLYSVLSTLVTERTAEIGVRMSLGADRASIFRLIVGHGLRFAALGLVIGVPLALALARSISALLVDVAATDVPTLLGVGAAFVAVVAAACAQPALRAARITPVDALRQA